MPSKIDYLREVSDLNSWSRDHADREGMRKLSTGELVMCASGAGALGGLAGNPAGTPLELPIAISLRTYEVDDQISSSYEW
jgi:hypothetical protein